MKVKKRERSVARKASAQALNSATDIEMEIQLENQLAIISIVNKIATQQHEKKKRRRKQKNIIYRDQDTCKQFNHLHFWRSAQTSTHRRICASITMIRSNIERKFKAKDKAN